MGLGGALFFAAGMIGATLVSLGRWNSVWAAALGQNPVSANPYSGGGFGTTGIGSGLTGTGLSTSNTVTNGNISNVATASYSIDSIPTYLSKKGRFSGATRG